MYINEHVNKCIYMNMQINVHNYDLGGKLWSREKSCKPSYLLLHTVWIGLGIGTAVIERAIERRKNDNNVLLVFTMFDFVCIYSKVQHLCFRLHTYLNMCIIDLVWQWYFLNMNVFGKKYVFEMNQYCCV